MHNLGFLYVEKGEFELAEDVLHAKHMEYFAMNKARHAWPWAVKPFSCDRPVQFIWIIPKERERPSRKGFYGPWLARTCVASHCSPAERLASVLHARGSRRPVSSPASPETGARPTAAAPRSA